MKPIYLFVLLLCSCKNDSKVIKIWIENNSDINRSIEISTYFNDSLIDKRNIVKDSIADRIRLFKVDLKLQDGKLKSVLKFVSPIHGEKTSCFIYLDSLDKTSLIHVNYVESILKKGTLFDNVILNRDTV